MEGPVDFAAMLDGEVVWIERPDGTRLRTVVMGSDGSDIVLAHGYGFNADEWNLVASRLVDHGHRVIAFDQRGHDRSTIGSDGIGSAQMAGDYVAILERHDVTDGVLVGHSMGGFLSVRFLLDHPEVVARRLRGCLLMATFAGDVNRSNPQNRLQIPLIKSGILTRLLHFGPIATAFTKSLTGEYADGMAEAFVPVFLRSDHRALIPILEAMVNENRYPQLGEIDLPVRIIVGTADHTTPPFHTDDLHAGIPGSTLMRLEGKGHALNWEDPDTVVAEIEELTGARAAG